MGVFQAIKYVSILIIVMMLAGGLYYAMNLKAALATSEANNAKLETAVESQNAVIEQKMEEINKIQDINKSLLSVNAKLQADVNKLNEKFNVSANGTSRDFGDITRAKPKVINKIIDKATAKSNRCFEIASGAELKEGEKNSECQELINSISK
jgi:predicted RND superfamily exporter protein